MIAPEAAASANLVRWSAGRPLVRCFQTSYGPTSFNPSPTSMRFRPTIDEGEIVPTAYAGEDGMIALAESVLREAALGADALLPVARLRGIEIVTLTYPHDLTLVQLNSPEPADVAQTLYDAQEGAQGIVWTSHQSDHGDAAILWGTRIDTDALTVLEGPVALDSAHGLELVGTACERLGVLLEH